MLAYVLQQDDVNSFGRSIQESVHGFVQGNSYYAPYAAHDKLTQYQSQKEWYGLTVCFDAAHLQDNPLG